MIILTSPLGSSLEAWLAPADLRTRLTRQIAAAPAASIDERAPAEPIDDEPERWDGLS